MLIGMTPPSAAPMSSRAPSISTNELAMPVRKEQTEKQRVARMSSPLRLPVLSETRPITNAAIAQVNDNALAR